MTKQGRLGERVAGVAGYGGVRTLGGVTLLLVDVLRLAVRPPYYWVGEAVTQASLAIRRTLVPLFAAVLAYNVGYSIVYFGGLLGALGAADRQGSGIFLGQIREIDVWVTSMVFCGIVSSAVCADLGARKIREELDALAVLGVDKRRALAVPRVVAVTLLAPVIGFIGLLLAMGVNYVIAPPYLGVARGPYFDSIRQSVFALDVYAFIIKYLLIGLMTGVVSCYKGFNVGRGAEGVGKAVNETVVIVIVGMWTLDMFYNLIYQSLFPSLAVLRG